MLLNMLKEKYSEYLITKTYKKDEVVFDEGEVCDKLGFVEDGAISISTYTLSSDTYSIDVVRSGMQFGSFLLFSSNPKYLGTGICNVQSTIIYIRKEDLFKIFSTDASLLEIFLSSNSDKAMKLQDRLKMLSQKSIKEKILFLVKSHMNSDGYYYFHSKEDIAKDLCVPRPSLSRAIIELEEDGIIKYGRHFIRYIK